MRQSRKLDHLKQAMALKDGPLTNGFADLLLVHNCLPDIAVSDVDLSCRFLGLEMSHPIIINAVTGGDKDVTEVNEKLAQFAKLTHSVMAVGSQFAAVEQSTVERSFKIVKEVNPDGIVFANLGAHATPEQAQQAIDMIDAKALQIHLNVAQELVMTEGDRDFSGYIANVAAIAHHVKVPVIVKEVGFGISREAAIKIVNSDVTAIDIGGAGGTNFVAIEGARSRATLDVDMLKWGIPTAVSTIEVLEVLPPEMELIVSGGIRTPLEVIKALALGGNAVGIAGPILRLVQENDIETAATKFEAFLASIKQYMVLLGTRNISDLSYIPVVITGKSRDWLTSRGIDVLKYNARIKSRA